jgi:hypothetical protein
MTIKPKVAPMPNNAAEPPPSIDINVMTEAGPNNVSAHVPNISAINICANVGWVLWLDIYSPHLLNILCLVGYISFSQYRENYLKPLQAK